MSTPARVFLFVLAAALMVVVYRLGTVFTYGAEPPARARGSEVFWLLLAAIFASPLWVPAFLSTRSRRVFTAVRWLSAAALLVPLGYAGSVAIHQLRLYPGPLFDRAIFTIAAALLAGCVAAIVMLLIRSGRNSWSKGVVRPSAGKALE